MASFGNTSQARLDTCHPILQQLFNIVVQHYDCTIVQGYRGKAEQDQYYAEGKSKLKFPDSKHNKYPSKAIDVAPYVKGKGVVWDREQCTHFGGFVSGIATMMGIKLRWGGNWNSSNDLQQNSFDDLPHFELLD